MLKKTVLKEIKLICLCLLSGIIISLFICNLKAYCDGVQSSIASKIIRLHVIADNDGDEAQNLKLYVRNKVIGSIPRAESRKDCMRLILGNIENIEKTAQQAVYEKGFDYKVTAELKKSVFPTRYYGTVTLPPGEYDTLEIKIGKGGGHNWWCVVYPPMCFAELDGETAENYENELNGILSEDEYKLVVKTDEPKIKIKFKIIEWFERKKTKS